MSARDIFESLVRGGWQRLEEMKRDGVTESLFLEFKGRADDGSKLGEFYKRRIARAVSGFANVEGGVLVLGVLAKAPEKGLPDVVVDLQPIPDVNRLRGQIEPFLNVCCDPKVPALQIETIPGGPDGAGVLVIYAPASDGGPHRAAQSDSETNDRYFMRTGSGTVTMPHSVLAALFGVRPPPRLELWCSLATPRTLRLWVKNVGRGIARDVLLRVTSTQVSGVQHEPLRWQPGVPGDTSWHQRTRSAISGDEIDVCFHLRDERIYPGESFGSVTADVFAERQVVIRARLDAEGMQPTIIHGAAQLLGDRRVPVEPFSADVVKEAQAAARAWGLLGA